MQEQVLVADYSVVCWSAEHRSAVVVCFIFMGIWVIGIPAFVAGSLIKNKKHLFNDKSERHVEVIHEYGSLYLQFEPEYYLFEVTVIFKKMLLTGALLVIGPGSSVQLVLALMVVLLNLLVVLKLMPYRDTTDDLLSFLVSLQMIITLLSALLLKTDKDNDKTYDPDMMGAGLVLINMMGLLVLVASIVALHPKVRAWINARGDHGAGTKVAPTETAPPTETEVAAANLEKEATRVRQWQDE
jgi:hypothetical protein